MIAVVDESWPMIEEAVFRLFTELGVGSGTGAHAAIGPRLADLGWSDIESEYPVEASELLFRAQGQFLAHTDCLDRVMVAELAALIDGRADHVLLPDVTARAAPRLGDQVSGIVLGPLSGRVVVPVSSPTGTVSVAVVDADRLRGERLDTFDPSVYWTRVTGPQLLSLVNASTEWSLAMAAARRGLAAELVAIADQALRIAVEHARVRVQFDTPIGSFQSPRHALADASATLEGARALLAQSWRYGGQLSAQVAKAAAGRAHRVVCDAALQVCGAIGLTAEHHLHRYVTRGFQIDALCGSYQQLETLIAQQLFDSYSPGQPVPMLTAWH
jgi:hypothetical protein